MPSRLRPLIPAAGGHTSVRSSFDALSVHNQIRATLASAAWHAANAALLIPFRVVRPTVVNQLSWYNGATQGANISMAIYDRTLARLVTTGAVAQSAGTSVLQTTDVTDTLLVPGLYFWGISADNVSVTFFGAPLVGSWRARFMGVLGMLSAHPLPATFVSDPTNALTQASLPILGHTERSVL